MATVIDSLVVALGLDSKDLENKGPAATRHLGNIEKQGAKTEKRMEGLSHGVKSFLAIIGGTMAIRAFVEDFVDANAQLDRFSKNIGLSVSNISAWGQAAERLGGSAEGLNGTLDMLSRSQTQLMLTGESSLIPYMSALGISLADTAGHARPVLNILLDLSDRFSHIDRTTANNMGRMMGIDQGTMNLLLEGRKELELEIKRQKEQTAVTAAQAAEATKLQKSITGVKQTFLAFGRTLLMDAAPSIEKLLTLFQRFGNWIMENGEFIEDFLKAIAVGLGAIELRRMLMEPTVVAIIALAGAIALLWQDYQVWKKGGDSFIDWGKWVHDIQIVMKWIKALADTIESAMHKFDSFYQKMTGSKFSTQVKSGLKAMEYGAGVALGVRGMHEPKGVQNRNLGYAIANQEGFFAKDKSPNRPQRNHNPGDIEYGDFAKRHGATGSDGRFAIFPDDATGMAALQALLASPNYANLSLEDKIKRFAPSNENNTAAYVASVKKYLGQPSGGSSYATALAGVPGASAVAASAPQGGQGSGSTVDRSVKVDIQQIDVKTNATDAQGMARDMAPSLDWLFASQANYGLN
jgi:hypothetical protein